VIALSRAAQVMNSEQCVKKLETQRGTGLAGETRLHVGGIHTGGRFRPDRTKSHESEGKGAVGRASSAPHRARQTDAWRNASRERNRHPASGERHKGVAGGVHRHSHEKSGERRGTTQNRAQ
jgi:hypothetical protein